MFSNIKVGDKVLVGEEGCKTDLFCRPPIFWVPMEVTRVTNKQFVAAGERYRKADGCRIPRGAHCLIYTKDKDESAQLKENYEKAMIVIAVNDLFYKLSKVITNTDTPNIHAIKKQAEVLASLLEVKT